MAVLRRPCERRRKTCTASPRVFLISRRRSPNPWRSGFRPVDAARSLPATVCWFSARARVGLAILEVARAYGAEVFITDIAPERLETARKLGATPIGSSDFVEEVARLTGSEGMPPP